MCCANIHEYGHGVPAWLLSIQLSVSVLHSCCIPAVPAYVLHCYAAACVRRRVVAAALKVVQKMTYVCMYLKIMHLYRSRLLCHAAQNPGSAYAFGYALIARIHQPEQRHLFQQHAMATQLVLDAGYVPLL